MHQWVNPMSYDRAVFIYKNVCLPLQAKDRIILKRKGYLYSWQNHEIMQNPVTIVKIKR